MKTFRLFLVSLWYRILYFMSPDWIRLEISRSMYCSEHKGLAKCDCWEKHVLHTTKREAENEQFKIKSHFWFEKQKLRQQLEDMEAELLNAKNSAKCWHEAWFDQRDATGKSYWSGYANGKRVAIAFHMNQAAQRHNAAKACTNETDRHYQELDARYHEWSADQIKLQGYDAVSDAHCEACRTSENKPAKWKPEGGLRPGETDH